MKTVYRILPVRLTKSDVDSRARKLAQVHGEYTRTEDQKKDAMKEFSDTLKSLRDESDTLSRVVNSGIEDQAVECLWEPEGTAMVLRRSDTGEEIERRAQTADERQGDLELN